MRRRLCQRSGSRWYGWQLRLVLLLGRGLWWKSAATLSRRLSRRAGHRRRVLRRVADPRVWARSRDDGRAVNRRRSSHLLAEHCFQISEFEIAATMRAAHDTGSGAARLLANWGHYRTPSPPPVARGWIAAITRPNWLRRRCGCRSLSRHIPTIAVVTTAVTGNGTGTH